MELRLPRRAWILGFALLACIAASTTVRAAGVKVEPVGEAASATTVKVLVGDKPFCEYLTHNGHQPVIWPIIGPGGRAMTRQYPLGDALEGEPQDHPHHRSLWFNHGSVNGRDFWLEPGDDDPDTQIEHREFVELASHDGVGKIVTRNDWTCDDQKVCEDRRTILFGDDVHGRWIDFAVEVTASEGDLTFGDTKEGAFGMRVAGTMGVDENKGGKIRNSRGQTDAVAWGQSAEWVDYSGPVDGQPGGIVIFDMPDSFRHPTRWHVRTYGLFAANPFGQRDFPPDDREQGEVTVKKGDKLRLHYRVLVYDGTKSQRELAEIYKKYTSSDKN